MTSQRVGDRLFQHEMAGASDSDLAIYLSDFSDLETTLESWPRRSGVIEK